MYEIEIYFMHDKCKYVIFIMDHPGPRGLNILFALDPLMFKSGPGNKYTQVYIRTIIKKKYIIVLFY